MKEEEGLRSEAHSLARGFAYAGLVCAPIPLLTHLHILSVPAGSTGSAGWILYLLSGILGPLSILIGSGLLLLAAYTRAWNDQLIVFSLILTVVSALDFLSYWRMPLL